MTPVKTTKITALTRLNSAIVMNGTIMWRFKIVSIIDWAIPTMTKTDQMAWKRAKKIPKANPSECG